ncbi:hypothetical protein IW261DRAFT_1569857 [Armillaria novae-zelandiae]|uniref:BTB domain-containing protein n=1 Tax=Armillaria novae-zelandiae TaxID=153914 RepID=A0AA39TYD3_9AGAR|nr:hypothetical protein IW261DRAFT_1569857 [Armillaria novae-zelandiae]
MTKDIRFDRGRSLNQQLGKPSGNQAGNNCSPITPSLMSKHQTEMMEYDAAYTALQPNNVICPYVYTIPPSISTWTYAPPSVPNTASDMERYSLANVLPTPAPPITDMNLMLHSFMAKFVSADIEECASRLQLDSRVDDLVFECCTPLPNVLPHSYQQINAISTKFNIDFKHNGIPPDTRLVSSDLVLFLVHRHMLADTSTNRFNTLLDSLRPCTIIPETSDFLNIILHAIYGHSCSQFQPNIDTLMTAVCLFPKYGLQPKRYIHPSSPLFNDIRYQMPLLPLTTYVVSSYYELEDLAIITSGHLLTLDISTMSEETVEFINPVYLKRLFDLQQMRLDKLKRLFDAAPSPHPATPRCDFIAQKSFTRAWSLYTTRLLWDARADLTAGTIERTYRTLDDHVACFDCKCALREHVKGIVIEWSEQKVCPRLHRWVVSHRSVSSVAANDLVDRRLHFCTSLVSVGKRIFRRVSHLYAYRDAIKLVVDSKE